MKKTPLNNHTDDHYDYWNDDDADDQRAMRWRWWRSDEVVIKTLSITVLKMMMINDHYHDVERFNDDDDDDDYDNEEDETRSSGASSEKSTKPEDYCSLVLLTIINFIVIVNIIVIVIVIVIIIIITITIMIMVIIFIIIWLSCCFLTQTQHWSILLSPRRIIIY